MGNNLDLYINDTDMLNENIQAQTDTNANVGGAVQSNESNLVEKAPKEQMNGQVTNNAAGRAAPLKEVTGKEREELTKEEEKDVKECINELRDIATMVCGILTRPDGKLVDFSDKEGRKELKNTMLAFKTQMQSVIKDANLENKNYAETIANAIPKKIDAELVNEDRERIDWLRRFWKRCILALFLVVLVACGSFYFSGKEEGEYVSRSAELERWYTDNNDAVNFGNYLKEKAPRTYNYYHSGQWEKDEALIDSLKRVNKFHEWK